MDAVACSLAGGFVRDLRGHAKGVKRWFETHNFVLGGHCVTRRAPRRRRVASPPAYTRPPLAEVQRFLDACRPVADVPCVADYLRGRHLEPYLVEDRRLAVAIPDGIALPSWCVRDRRSWREGLQNRLVLPLFGADGRLESVRARAVDPTTPETKKSTPPSGYQVAGLVMADALGRQLLQTGHVPEWWDPEVPLEVVVAKGEVDFLTIATSWGDAAVHAPAVLGIFSGSWTLEIALRIPDRTHIRIATDGDAKGEEYARRVVETFAGRTVRLFRTRAPQERAS